MEDTWLNELNCNGYSHQNSSAIPTLTNEESLKIWEILKSWNLECVYQACIDQCIDIEVLGCMNNKHIGLLLSNFPLGIRVKFEKHVHQYQTNQKDNHDNLTLEPRSISVTPFQNAVLSNESKLNPSEIIFDLNKILTKSSQGSMIVDYYFNHKNLNESCRTLLVELIINDIIKQYRPMTIDLANNIANAIVVSFPSEIKDVYFLKDKSSKAPKGKVYSKYFNTMKRLRQFGLKSTDKTKYENEKTVCRSEDKFDRLLEIEPDSEDISKTLQYDENLSWPEIEIMWKKTINFRLQFIKDNNTASIFKKWVHYTKPMGYKLVEIDFSRLYSNFKNIGDKFEAKSSALMSILNERVKDSASKTLLSQLKEADNLCENGKNLTILYLLHSLFIPTSKKVTVDENGKKSIIKYSIRDSQNTFVIVASTPVELEITIDKLKTQKNSIQPCILVVGSLLYPKQILIYFDDVKYKLFTAFKAIDVCFKIFHVFNLEYSFESSNVWLFLQIYFFEIRTKYDKSCSLRNQIISELEVN